MYDCTQSRDAINHYLPKFPEYCPAYHSLALFQTFQYPWLFEKGRSSASSMSLFRTHRRSTAEQKCESKCRKQKKKKKKKRSICATSSEGRGTSRSIHTDNRSLIPFDFYYRNFWFVPHENHVSFWQSRFASFSVFRLND